MASDCLLFKANLNSAFTKAKIMGFVGAVVAGVMSFATVITLSALGVPAGSLAWDNALATGIAGAITALVMFIVFTALGPIGSVIQAIFALVDMLAGMICKLTGAAEKAPVVARWFCGGLTGLVTNIFKTLIYSGNVIVDMQDEDRIDLGGFGFNLKYPDRGITQGNEILPYITYTNTIKLAPIPVDSLWANLADEDWTNHNVHRSSFKYGWSASAKDDQTGGLGLIAAESSPYWPIDREADGTQPYRFTDTVHSATSFPLPKVGIYATTAYLTEGYAVPEQECWGIFPIGGCWVHANKSNNPFDLTDALMLTVLPPTIDGFRNLKHVTSPTPGDVLDWGGGTGLNFPLLYDADNDGLPRASDPNDGLADADGDGLLDGYEVEIGSNPAVPDSDGDGLWDGDELRNGTDPVLKDSDGDGLQDNDEVKGWEFVYGFDPSGNQLKSWVWPDPLAVDADNDGLTDFQEKTYGYNPAATSNPNVLTLKSELREGTAVSDDFVVPGQALTYNAIVKNELFNRQAQGQLWSEASPVLDDSGVKPTPFVLRATEQSATSGNVTVSGAAASGVYSMTQVAGALIADWSEAATKAGLWLRFDDPARPFYDYSGSVPPHDGACLTGSGTSSTGCTLDANGHFGSALKLTGSSYVWSAAGVGATGYAVSLWFKTTTGGPLFIGETAGKRYSVSDITVLDSGIYARVNGTGEQIASYRNWMDGKWHHVVQTLGYGMTGTNLADMRHKLYVDGVLVATGAATFLTEPVASSYVGQSIHSSSSGYVGSIDDVRLFDHQLTMSDVRELFDQPVLSLNFDSQVAWPDVSSFAGSVTCTGIYCPRHEDQQAVAGRAARFDGANWLSTSGNQLSLGDGRVTLSAWVYPVNNGTGADTYAQGILGYHRNEADAYPYLDRQGLKIGFGFSDGTTDRHTVTDNDVLTLNAWNHVVATFGVDDNVARLYVNGKLVKADATAFQGVTRIASTKTLEIGRASDYGKLTISKFDAVTTGEGSCGAWFHGEMCVAMDGVELIDRESVSCDSSNNVSVERVFRNSATLTQWEDDGDDHCGDKADDGDDKGTLSKSYFTSSEVGRGIEITYSGAGSGTFYSTLTTFGVPFVGFMDDVRVYSQVLDEDAVGRLYRSTILALRLPLDDPPGTSAFTEAGVGRAEVGCVGHCPNAGLPGRIDQAATFDGASYLQMGNHPVNRLTSSFSVAAWIKPASLSGNQRIVSVANTASGNGWGFGLSGSNLMFTTYDVKDYYPTGVTLPLNQWSHVTAVMDAAYGVTFYVNGSPAPTVPGTAAGNPDSDDSLMIGGTTSGSLGLFQPFHGMLDEIQVFNAALSAGEIQRIYHVAPVAHLRLDEARGATQFADSARFGVNATCSGSTCPAAGEAVKGELGLAVQFTRTGSYLTVPAATALDLDKFTVGGWVKPTSTKNVQQRLLTKSGSGKTNYQLTIDANSMTPRLSFGCTTPTVFVTGTNKLIKDHWNQLLGTYDGAYLRLYVNGSLAHAPVAATGSCTVPTAPLYAGGAPSASAESLAGMLDDVVVYNRALQAGEVYDLFVYQGSWVEDRKSRNLTVDADNPTAEVLLNAPAYIPKAATTVPIKTDDQTSGVASAKLCVAGACRGRAALHRPRPHLVVVSDLYARQRRRVLPHRAGHGPGRSHVGHFACRDRAGRR